MKNMMFLKMVLEGSHYEIGKKKGEFLKTIPYLNEIYTGQPKDVPGFTKEEAEQRVAYLEAYCPGIADELRGVADGLLVKLEQLYVCLMFEFQKQPCACSELLVLPMKTKDGHCYLARSYEYSFEDEFQLNITRAEGAYSHIGFSLFLGGRFDGINEKGLCIAMSSCECVESSSGKASGLPFHYVIRAILDSCATTKEAMEKLENTPMCFNANFMIVDATGDFVVAEILTYDGKAHVAYRRDFPYCYALNHYQTKEQKEKAPEVKNFSKLRADAIDAFFAKKGLVSKEDVVELLSTKLPNGLCCHAYGDWFGTLRSMLFDVTDGKVEVCMGSPVNSSFMEVSLEEEEGITPYEVEFEEERVPLTYWKVV